MRTAPIKGRGWHDNSPSTFHNRAAPARHLSALNGSCLQGPTQIYSSRPRLFDKLPARFNIFSPHGSDTQQQCPPSPALSTLVLFSTYIHAWGGTQCTADLSGHVRSSAVLQGLLPGLHLCSYNGMLTHLALQLSTRGLWEQTHFFSRTRQTHTSAKDKTIPRQINKFLGNNKNNFNVFTDQGSVKAFFFFFFRSQRALTPSHHDNVASKPLIPEVQICTVRASTCLEVASLRAPGFFFV